MLLAIFGSLNALFATASRCPLAMARDGSLPAESRRSTRGQERQSLRLSSNPWVLPHWVFHGSFIQTLSVSFVVDWTFKVLLIASLLRKKAGNGRRGLAFASLPAWWCAVVALAVIMAAISEARWAALGYFRHGPFLPALHNYHAPRVISYLLTERECTQYSYTA